MEKRLAQTSLNLEVADASNRTLLHELQETRDSVTRLSSLSMKAVGWEARVQSLTEERDDLREEKRAESSRARAAEGRANALADKCGMSSVYKGAYRYSDVIIRSQTPSRPLQSSRRTGDKTLIQSRPIRRNYSRCSPPT